MPKMKADRSQRGEVLVAIMNKKADLHSARAGLVPHPRCRRAETLASEVAVFLPDRGLSGRWRLNGAQIAPGTGAWSMAKSG